ncbi:hypothetical protein BDV93DRAFT_541420 [Ceratobasidium sp. AG-I]|nr:hypothetical protein BDV93DRAFT_541420 [Ceratobasidium sp. AG-I]
MLYPELWLMIAERLETDRASIMKLMILSKMTYRVLQPVLYDTVALCDNKSVSLFCESISLPLSSRRSDLVKSLSVVPGYSTPSRQLISIVPQVRLIMSTLKNLERLTLTLTPTGSFGELFQGLECTFRLTHLTCACYPDDYFAGFLQQQTSITELNLGSFANAQWGVRQTVGLVNHYNRRLASHLPFLPCLTSVTSDSIALKVLCVGRPITRVVVTELLPTHGDALATSIAQSTTLVRSLTIEISTRHEWQDDVLLLLDPLKSTSVASTITDLRILFDSRSAHMIRNGLPRSDLGIGVSLDIAWLAGFTSLERFELGFIPKTFQRVLHPSNHMVSNIVYDKEAWRSSFPTLKEIWVFGARVV